MSTNGDTTVSSPFPFPFYTFTLPGQKHHKGPYTINEDLPGVFTFQVQSLEQGGGKETAAGFFLADGHGEALVLPLRSEDFKGSNAQRLVGWIQELLPSTVEELVGAAYDQWVKEKDAVTAAKGDPWAFESTLAERNEREWRERLQDLITAKLETLHTRLDEQLVARDERMCGDNGSTLVLGVVAHSRIWFCNIGDSSMMLFDKATGRPLKVWQRKNGLDSEPALCSFEDTLAHFPVVREGQTKQAVQRDFESLKDNFRLRKSPNGGPPTFPLVSPRSAYVLSMTNCLGNMNHKDKMCSRCTVYSWDVDELLRFTTSGQLVALFASDGIKDRCNAATIGRTLTSVESALRHYVPHLKDDTPIRELVQAAVFQPHYMTAEKSFAIDWLLDHIVMTDGADPDLRASCEALVRLAILRGTTDDATVLVVDMSQEGVTGITPGPSDNLLVKEEVVEEHVVPDQVSKPPMFPSIHFSRESPILFLANAAIAPTVEPASFKGGIDEPASEGLIQSQPSQRDAGSAVESASNQASGRSTPALEDRTSEREIESPFNIVRQVSIPSVGFTFGESFVDDPDDSSHPPSPKREKWPEKDSATYLSAELSQHSPQKDPSDGGNVDDSIDASADGTPALSELPSVELPTEQSPSSSRSCSQSTEGSLEGAEEEDEDGDEDGTEERVASPESRASESAATGPEGMDCDLETSDTCHVHQLNGVGIVEDEGDNVLVPNRELCGSMIENRDEPSTTPAPSGVVRTRSLEDSGVVETRNDEPVSPPPSGILVVGGTPEMSREASVISESAGPTSAVSSPGNPADSDFGVSQQNTLAADEYESINLCAVTIPDSQRQGSEGVSASAETSVDGSQDNGEDETSYPTTPRTEAADEEAESFHYVGDAQERSVNLSMFFSQDAGESDESIDLAASVAPASDGGDTSESVDLAASVAPGSVGPELGAAAGVLGKRKGSCDEGDAEAASGSEDGDRKKVKVDHLNDGTATIGSDHRDSKQAAGDVDGGASGSEDGDNEKVKVQNVNGGEGEAERAPQAIVPGGARLHPFRSPFKSPKRKRDEQSLDNTDGNMEGDGSVSPGKKLRR
ncbi:hypothetical protein HK104_005750 [Borealophlyctis nickersoniae]|nr:hypothetical protein HK104_005750 [Borealophlyctis nickersoniae]